MKNLLTQVAISIKQLSDNLLNSIFRNHIADIYELLINDHDNRITQMIRFSTIKEAMEWVNSKGLLYDPAKAVYLIRVKPTGMNNILRLNICENVPTKGSSVLRSKNKSKAVPS
jgi:hypothetical protein